MEPFKEKRHVEVLINILYFLAVSAILNLVIGISFNIFFMFFAFMTSITLAIIVGIIVVFTETKSKYSSLFISYINAKIQTASTIEEFTEIRNEFLELSAKDGIFILTYPRDLNRILRQLDDMITLLHRIEK